MSKEVIKLWVKIAVTIFTVVAICATAIFVILWLLHFEVNAKKGSFLALVTAYNVWKWLAYLVISFLSVFSILNVFDKVSCFTLEIEKHTSKPTPIKKK